MTTVEAPGEVEAKGLSNNELHVETEDPASNPPAENGLETKSNESTEPKGDAGHQETAKNAENGEPLSPRIRDVTSPASSSDERRGSIVGDARSKFETQGSFDKKSSHKRKEKVKYAGLATAKTRFIDAATADDRKPQEKKKPKRITPPRDGNLSGVVESEPAERDPNVIRSDTLLDDEIPTSTNARSNIEKFRGYEKGDNKGTTERGENKVDVDTAVTKNLMTVWKDRETNPQPESNQQRKSQVKIREEGDGGVYENNPEVLTDVVRATDQLEEVMPEGVDTRALRDRFLRGSLEEDGSAIKKLSALEEITRMARLEQNVVYENIPSVPPEGVVRSTNEETDEIGAPINTKELREKFINRKEEKTEKKLIKIAEGEGGVYENQPVQLDENIIRSGDYEAVNVQDEVGRWTSEAKQRFMEDACRITSSIQKKEKGPVQLELAEGGVFENEPSLRRADVVSEDTGDIDLPENTVKKGLQRLHELKEENSKVRTSKTPVIVSENDTSAGVYENVPQSSRADVRAVQTLEDEENAAATARYAAEAKQRFIEKQKLEAEAKKKKETPQMIDIWSDLCKDSGVFENKPAEHDPNVVREFTPESDEESDEDYDEDEDEERQQHQESEDAQKTESAEQKKA